MAVFKQLTIPKEADIKTLVKTFYRFTEELKHTFNNLDDDNMSQEYLLHEQKRKDRARTLKFDGDSFRMEFEDYEKDTRARLEQTREEISLLVESGEVVETMLSRMELCGDHIALTSGHVIFDSQNMSIDRNGNAAFSGNITGGTMVLGDHFAVDAQGNASVVGNLTVSVMSGMDKVTVMGGVDVEDDEDYGYCTIGDLTCGEAYVNTRLSYKKRSYISDARKKTNIQPLCEDVVRSLRPVQFYFKTGNPSMGFIAQEVEMIGSKLPLVKDGEIKKIPYGNYAAVYAKAIQENEKRIEKLKEELKKQQRSEMR